MHRFNVDKMFTQMGTQVAIDDEPADTMRAGDVSAGFHQRGCGHKVTELMISIYLRHFTVEDVDGVLKCGLRLVKK
jgi:hypothetical protein